ncbi:MAG: hypothetical protein H6906_02840 [Hyphomicrobiales bacterium]|nr:hypothetical protein [Hyphomicrobiales bacterium]
MNAAPSHSETPARERPPPGGARTGRRALLVGLAILAAGGAYYGAVAAGLLPGYAGFVGVPVFGPLAAAYLVWWANDAQKRSRDRQDAQFRDIQAAERHKQLRQARDRGDLDAWRDRR